MFSYRFWIEGADPATLGVDEDPADTAAGAPEGAGEGTAARIPVDGVYPLPGIDRTVAGYRNGRIVVLDEDRFTATHGRILATGLARARAAVEAETVKVLALTADAFARTTPAPGWEASLAGSEIAAATGQDEGPATGRIHEALQLRGERRASLRALEDGLVSPEHVRTILRACEGLQPLPVTAPAPGAGEHAWEAYRSARAAAGEKAARARDRMEAALLAHAPGRPPRLLAAKARRLRPSLDEVAPPERARRAQRHRRTWLAPEDDGMCTLGIRLDAVSAHAIHDRLHRIARSMRNQPGETRTMDQLRADAATELLLSGTGTTPGTAAIRPEIMIILPHTALTALPPNHDNNTNPAGPGVQAPPGGLAGNGLVAGCAELAGYGPIDLETARAYAARARTWERLYAAPDGTSLVAMGRSSYRPTKDQRRLIAARTPLCTHPGCTRPALQSDTDHVTEWQHGGTTDLDNLSPACPKHHTYKTIGAWRTTLHPDGTTTHTSPTGTTYTTTPAIPWTTTPTPAPTSAAAPPASATEGTSAEAAAPASGTPSTPTASAPAPTSSALPATTEPVEPSENANHHDADADDGPGLRHDEHDIAPLRQAINDNPAKLPDTPPPDQTPPPATASIPGTTTSSTQPNPDVTGGATPPTETPAETPTDAGADAPYTPPTPEEPPF
ncbi:DUF222 domain-containing protein [Zafaria sp. Z1313]|uniref:HNH endonuclease signature motif containing protein n=1 Tax=Zafaria sp. Z1313 TaxID=3423202 RepID=UPI003D3020CD